MDPLIAEDRLQLARELALVTRRLRLKVDERLKSLGMSQSRGAVLYWLSDAPEGLSQTALAERAGVEPATLVRTLDQLEGQGLVERQPSPFDRRVNLVRLTEAAKPVLKEVFRVGEEVRREVMAGVSREDLQVTLAILRRMHARLDDAGQLSGGTAAA